MSPLAAGSLAPPIPEVDLSRPTAVVFYKVTCPVCHLAAPVIETMQRAYPGHVVGVGEDPPERLDAFGDEYDWSFPSVPDLEPYPLSDEWGVRVVPTVFVLEAPGTVVDVVESWDRDGFNRASRRLSELTGRPYSELSSEGDGRPPFRPG